MMTSANINPQKIIKTEIGRPSVMTDSTLQKLYEVFGIGGSDREACFYANIAQQTLYNYQKDHPEFLEHKEALKENPILKARRTVVKGLDEDYEFALRYLERKRRDEFSLRTELTGANGRDIIPILGGSTNAISDDNSDKETS